jgi:hypothetical protein
LHLLGLSTRNAAKALVFAYCQEKPRCNLKVDSETSHQKDVLRERGFCIYGWRDGNQGWFKTPLVMGRHGTKNRQILALFILKERNMFVVAKAYPMEKGIIERTMQYTKDRTESFDGYFSCRKKKCKRGM